MRNGCRKPSFIITPKCRSETVESEKNKYKTVSDSVSQKVQFTSVSANLEMITSQGEILRKILK